jgi:hypothetical protein
MKRRATALCALNFLGAVAFAQSSTPNTSGTIAGRVLRADTGAPMASALVTLMPDTEGATVSDRRTRTREASCTGLLVRVAQFANQFSYG